MAELDELEDDLPAEDNSGEGSVTDDNSAAGSDFPETLGPDAFAQQAGPSQNSQSDFPDTISPEAFDASPNTASRSGAMARGLVEGAAPGVGGLAAGIATGSGIGSLLAPGPGTAVGGIVGGLAVGMGAGWLIQQGQDWVLDKLGLRDSGPLSREQQSTDEAQFPYSKFAAEMAPSAGLLRAGGTLAQRGLAAGIGAAAGAGADYLQTGHVDPVKAAMSAAFGAALPNARFGGGHSGTDTGEPPRPRAPGGGLDGEVLPPDQQALGYDNTGKYAHDIEFATQQRDEYNTGDPFWNYWNEYIIDLQNRADGKGGLDVDASMGPASDDHPFTYQDADRANDVTTTAAGVATENHPAPNIEGAGNPVGAPMQARTAQRPSGLLRDYRKEAPATRGEVVTQESTPLSQASIHEDVAAALAGEQPEVGTNVTPRLDEGAFSQAMQHGVQQGGEPPPIQSGLPTRRPQLPALNEEHALDVARAQREGTQRAVEGGRRGQDGEAFQPEGDAQGAPRPRAPVTEAVTPQEQRVLDTARKALTDAKMNTALERLNALPPKQAAVAATKLLTAMQSKTGEATAPGSEGEVRLPGKRPELASGATARSKADAARKQGVLNAYEKATAKFGKGAEGEAQGALLDRLKNLVSHADELTGSTTYRPNVKPPSWQLVQAARKVLSKPTPSSIKAFRSTEATLAGEGKTVAEQSDDARLTQETNRIESDIEKRPQLSDAGTEAATRQPDNEGRPEHEHFTNEDGAESAVYTRQHNQLTGWLSNLSDEGHAFLMKEHPDLVINVKTTQDPHELMNNLMDDLADHQRKTMPAAFEAVPSENSPVTKRSPVKSRADLASTEPGAPAGPGRSLKGTPEFGKLAEQYGGPAPKKTYSLEHEEAQRAPIDGSDRSLFDSMRDFLSDENGAVPLDRAARWVKDKITGYFTPRADPAAMDYGSQIGMRGVKLRTDISRAKAEVLANARASENTRGAAKLTPAEKGRVYRAAERNDTGNLPAPLKEYWDTYWKPMLDKVESTYDELREITLRNSFPGWDTMPERASNTGDGFMRWMPRRTLTEPTDDSFEPITNKSSLSNWAASAQERDWFTLHNNDTGDRKVFRVNADGNMVFYKDHSAGSAKTPPGSFDPRAIGATLKVGNQRMVVDHATIDEIMRHGNGEDGKPLKYSDNPGYVISDAYVGLKGALYRAKLLDAILHDKAFANLSTTKKAIADERFGKGNYSETILPQLKGRYFPDPVAWAFDDLVKTGFKDPEGTLGWVADKTTQVAQATLKPFYFLGPEVHVFNELDKYITLHGLNHANVPREVKAFGRAIKSVRMQDDVQREIMDAGGNPMFLHALTSRIMPQIAKIVGEDLARQQWKYDPLMKMFGVNARELSTELYRGSNKLMWWQSDVLYTASYLQFRDQGLSPQEAVRKTEHIIDSYVLPMTVGKSLGLEGTGAGRALQKFLADPRTSLFGRFHYGLYSSAAQMVKNLVGVNGMKGMANGAAQAALMLGMYMVVYPALSHLYGKMTGNKDSEFERRGVTRLAGTAADVVTGKKHDQDLLRNVWTPSTLVQMGMEQMTNRDWTGKEIADQPYGSVKGAVRNTGRRAERAAQSLVSPYGTVSRAAETPGATPGWVGQKFIESNFGLKTPTPGAQKYEAQRERQEKSLMRQHERKPGGLIERGANWLTR